MALYLDSGVSQISPSTPEVLLPLLSVTRFTAKALPLNEWVRSRCKACTLPQRPSRVAFTMRACSRLTRLSCLGQLIWSQPRFAPEEAHAIFTAFICDFFLWLVLLLSRNERPAGSGPAFAAG